MNKFFLLLVLIIPFTACNSKKNEQQKNIYSNSEFVGFSSKAKKIVPKLKSSHDLVLFFELINVPYKPQLMNNPNSVERYKASNLLAAANMGVYFADAMYQQSYGKTEGADSSIMAAINLSVALNLNEVFEKLATKRDRDEVSPIDSLIFKMDESLMQAEYILAENERMQIYISMLTGNFIQKQHILLCLLFELEKEQLDDNTRVSVNELLFVLGQFKEASQSLVELIEKYKPADSEGFLAKETIVYNNNLHSLPIENMHNWSLKMIFENEHLNAMDKSIDSMRSYIIGVN